MEINDFDNIYYNYLINLYTDSDNLEIVEEIKDLKLKYPDFPFEHYVKGVFTDAHITCYGMDFLFATSKFKDAAIYSYGLKGSYEKSKVEIFLVSNNLKHLDNEFVINDNFDLQALYKINDLLDEMNIIQFLNTTIRSTNGLSIINNLIDKKIEFINIQFLSNNFEIIGREHLISKYICDENFSKFIRVVDINYLNTNTKLETFLLKYDNYSEVFTNLNSQHLNEERTNKLNAALFASYILPFDIKTIDDIDNYYTNRYETICNTIKGKDILEIKDIISRVYYNCDYKDLSMHIIDAKKIFNEEKFNYNNLKKYFQILEIKNHEDSMNLINEIIYESNIIKKIEDTQKEVASTDIIEKLHSFRILRSSDFIYLKGEKFISLLHKIKGYGNYEMATKLLEDPRLWLVNPEEKEYISTSLCNEKYFGLVEGNGYILGFNTIPHGSIIGMGTEDIYMTRRIAKNNLNNSKNRFLLADDLVDNSRKMYNEVAIKRIVDGKPITPDLVFTQDKCSSKEKDVASFFDIPICILVSEVYAAQMSERQQIYLNENNFTEYIASLKKMYFSFANNYAITSKYFNFNRMKINLENIVLSFLEKPIKDRSKLYELINMVSEYGKLIDAKNFMDDGYDFLDIKEIEEKIKKKI